MSEAESGRGPEDGRPSNWTARILAPLALLIVAGTVLVLVTGNLDGDDGRRGDREDRDQSASTEGCQPDAESALENGYFVIEPGEDLSVVADRTCIPIDELIELNPNLDPQLIQVGSCVDLVPDGCKALAD
jgi:hypothetical protein